MLALAGRPLGIDTVHLDPAPDACAGQVAPLVVGALDDAQLIGRLCVAAAAVTIEVEHVPLAAFEQVPDTVPTWPPATAVAIAQDRLREKRLFGDLGIAAPAFAPVDGPGDLATVAQSVGFPLLLKTRRGGFDGRGQALVRDVVGLEAAWRLLGERGLIAEAFVPFDYEVSQIVVRAADGAVAAYPLVANVHDDGILRVSRVPAAGDPGLADEAQVAACSPTRSRRASTTPVTGRSRAPRRASSRTTCGPSAACRWGRRP